MMSRQNPPAQLLDLATAQKQMLSMAQCEQMGFSRFAVRRLVEQGLWTRVVPGLVQTQSGPPSWLGLVWGGVLLGGDQARVGGLAAAHLYGLIPDPPPVIKIHTVRQIKRQTGPWHFQREAGGGRSKSRGAPPRLSVEDTVLDLCADPCLMEGIIMSAISGRLTTSERLRRQAEWRGRISHGTAVRRLLHLTDHGVHSHLERRFLEEVEQAHGLPCGSRQRSIVRGDTVDVVYEEFHLIIEVDGRVGHTGNGAFRDMQRDNGHVIAGYTTLRLGYDDIINCPCDVAAMIAEVLRQRGWSGGRACSRCEAASSV